ncbi:MAG: LysO family transporter [Bacteroidales bacterium]|nr:LysO family transporter [Bacteroidales bacterium]
MLLLLGILFGGLLIGYLLKGEKKIEKWLDKLIMIAIFLLLFFIGIDVGANELIINNLHKIGFNALILTIGGVLGTILMSTIVYKKYFKDNTNK